MKTRFIASLLLTLLMSYSVLPQSVQQLARPSAATVTRDSGGTIQTDLGRGVVLNKNSSLTREWIAVHDPALPVKLIGTPGVRTVYVPNRVSGEYQYTARSSVEIKEPIVALSIKFLLFDVWGNHIKTLLLSEVRDMKSATDVSGDWRVYSENEVSEFYASIAYISHVRTQSGRVIEGAIEPVLTEARKFSRKFTAESLEPKTEKK